MIKPSKVLAKVCTHGSGKCRIYSGSSGQKQATPTLLQAWNRISWTAD